MTIIKIAGEKCFSRQYKVLYSNVQDYIIVTIHHKALYNAGTMLCYMHSLI